MNNNEYLKRKLVEGVSYIIDNNNIKIDCSHTSWITCSRIKKINKNDILGIYKKIYQLAISNNTSVGRKNGYKKYILENYLNYEYEVTYYNNLFNQLIEKCKQIQVRGIHSGTCDDEVLQEALNLRNEYSKAFHGYSVNSHINDIYNSLSKLYEGFTKLNHEYIKIVL